MDAKQKKRRNKSIANFNKKATTTCNLRLNFKTDSDIIQKLNEVPSKMGYIKSLIRKDIISSSK